MKVLHLLSGLNRGGLEMWVLSMLRTVPRDVCAMDIGYKGASPGPLAPRAEQLGARILACPLGVDHVRFARRLRRILIDGEYQVLHNHLHAYSGLPVWVARKVGVPVVTSFHNTHAAPQVWLTRLPGVRHLRSLYAAFSMRYALGHSEVITGCSRAVLEQIVPPHKRICRCARVVYYGVETDSVAGAIDRAAFRRSFGWPDDTPLVLHVGRFIEQKNHAGVLAIFRHVLGRLPNAKLLLVGDGPLRPHIAALIEEWGLSSAVHLLGPRDDVPFLMHTCDVFVLPSHHEGLGLVALEAAAAALPVVASRLPAIDEAVRDRETGFLHQVDDLLGMAESIYAVLTDRCLAERLGSAARAWVIERFSLQASAASLMDVYRYACACDS